jgi:hypothetical protein
MIVAQLLDVNDNGYLGYNEVRRFVHEWRITLAH